VLAKLFQIYGKGDSPNNLLPYVYSTLLKNEPVLMGSGMGLRDWLHVDDLVRGLVSCWESGGTRKFSEYDMGSGELHSIKEIVTRMAALMRKPERLLKFDSTRDRGDVSANKKAHHFPGAWHPNIDLEKGLRMIIAQYSEGSDILCGESIR
jgi:nucleoside-diphosphate-sugar epimerase